MSAPKLRSCARGRPLRSAEPHWGGVRGDPRPPNHLLSPGAFGGVSWGRRSDFPREVACPTHGKSRRAADITPNPYFVAGQAQKRWRGPPETGTAWGVGVPRRPQGARGFPEAGSGLGRGIRVSARQPSASPAVWPWTAGPLHAWGRPALLLLTSWGPRPLGTGSTHGAAV